MHNTTKVRRMHVNIHRMANETTDTSKCTIVIHILINLILSYMNLHRLTSYVSFYKRKTPFIYVLNVIKPFYYAILPQPYSFYTSLYNCAGGQFSIGNLNKYRRETLQAIHWREYIRFGKYANENMYKGCCDLSMFGYSRCRHIRLVQYRGC